MNSGLVLAAYAAIALVVGGIVWEIADCEADGSGDLALFSGVAWPLTIVAGVGFFVVMAGNWIGRLFKSSARSAK